MSIIVFRLLKVKQADFTGKSKGRMREEKGKRE
jgi:hypothetical protein